MDDNLLTMTREQILRARSQAEKRERWAHIRKLILTDGVDDWLQFWAEHWPPDKNDMRYAIGKDSRSLRRHVRVELHYLRMATERQERLESAIWG
jgi:hypothetical protein